MPDITLTFADGTQHVYKDAPDTLKPEDVYARATKDFPNQTLKDIARGGGVAAETQNRGVAGEAETPAARAPKRGGFSKQVGEALYTPAETPRIPTAEELVGRYKDIGAGTLQGVPAGIAGLPGDIGSLVGIPNDYTSHALADAMFGPAGSRDVQSGRTIGGLISGFAGPAAATKVVAPLREAAEAARLAKTAQALRGAEFALDPLSPIIGGAVNVGAKGYNKLRDAANYVLAPGATTENRLVALAADPAAARQAVINAQNTLSSGGTKSLAELMAEGNVAEPKIAAAQTALAEGATAPQVQQAQQARIAAIQSNMGNVGDQVRITTRELTPEMRGDPAAVQAGLEAQVAAEQAAQAQRAAAEEARLQTAGRSVANQIPDPSQQAVGARLTEIAEQIANQSRQDVVRPAYARVVAEGGAVPINIDRALEAAQGVRGSAAGLMDASAAPEGVRALERFRAEPLPGEFTPSIIPGLPGRTGAPIPQPSAVTTGDFMTVRAALAQDRSAASAAQNYTGARNIRQVMDELDASLRTSGVSPRTLELFDEARGLHLSEVVERTGSGETAQMLQQNKYNRPGILPEDVAAAFLKSETPAQQFVTTFRNDPAAARIMSEGINGLFRKAAVGADGLVDAQKAAAFVREHRRQLDILESSGIRVTDQLTAIAEQAATNARQRQALVDRTAQQRQAFESSTAKLRNARAPEEMVDVALASPRDMGTLLGQLNADQRGGLAAIVKNRVLDPIKAGNPDAAIKLLTENQGTIQQAIGRTGAAEHTALLNTANVQKQLDKLQGVVPNTGLYDPVVLASKFPRSQLTDLRTVANEVKNLKQVEALAAEGGGAKVAAKPSAASVGDLLSSFSVANPLAWVRVLGGKVKNAMEARVAAEAFKVIYENPERFVAAVDAAVKQKKTVESIRTGVNNLAPARRSVNFLANQQEAP